jgi:hypothetical protein
MAGKDGLRLLIWLAAVVLGYLLKTDYGAEGVCLILAFWLCQCRGSVWYPLPAVLLVLMGGIETVGVMAIPLIALYNGQKGTGKGKYFFYLSYPVHILILVLCHFLIFGKL